MSVNVQNEFDIKNHFLFSYCFYNGLINMTFSMICHFYKVYNWIITIFDKQNLKLYSNEIRYRNSSGSRNDTY